jgi:macrolide transport system ATP-binding/permease protein
VVVLSDGFWKRSFGSDPGVIGRSVSLNGKPFTIIGVATAGFSGVTRRVDVDIWVPLAALRPNLNERGSRGYFLIGRLRSGRSADELQTRLKVLAGQLHGAYPQNWTDLKKHPRKLTVVPESESRIPMRARTPVLGFLALLMTVVAMVLLIACANIASLLLARASARQREIGVRLAIGAGRFRLIRQLLTESLLLSVLGGVGGLVLAVWLTSLLTALKPTLPVPLAFDLSLDYRVLGFTILISILTGTLFGLAPAMQAARTDIVASLRESMTSGGSLRRFGLRNMLVVGQIAASLVLLIGAGLFLRSLQNAYDMDPGFRAGNMLLTTIDLGRQGYSIEKGKQFQQQFLERVRSLPGVEAAEFAKVTALGLEAMQRRGVQIAAYTPRPGEDMELHFNIVGPRYFETMRLPLVRGRSFTEQDREGAPLVAIVNEAFASRYWPGEDPIGKHVVSGDGGRERQVVGVARNAKYISLGEETRPYLYLPILQNYESQPTVHIRTAGDPGALTGPVRREAEALDSELPLIGVKSFNEHFGVSLLPSRVAATVLSAFGLLALLLAVTGLYGVIFYTVSQRTREIGIRMAMGAGTWDVLRMVVTQGMVLTLAGIVMGVTGAFAVTRLLATMLFGVSATDSVTFAGVSLLLTASALAACYRPARRAAKVHPMIALRYE